MRIFAVKDETDASDRTLAWLLYYEKAGKFYIELPDDADPWTTPLLLSSFLKKGQKSVNAYWSEMWVNQRIVPTDRQNLGQVLKDNGLKEYDAYRLLMLGNGRCAQDSYYLVRLQDEELPEELMQRFSKKIEDVLPLSEYNMLIFFRNGDVKKCPLKDYLKDRRDFLPLLSNESLFRRVRLSPGGNGILWGSDREISSEELQKMGIEVPLALEDFLMFVRERVLDSREAAELLHCSRQNLNELVDKKRLHPIRSSKKNTLYLKSEIEQRLHESAC